MTITAVLAALAITGLSGHTLGRGELGGTVLRLILGGGAGLGSYLRDEPCLRSRPGLTAV